MTTTPTGRTPGRTPEPSRTAEQLSQGCSHLVARAMREAKAREREPIDSPPLPPLRDIRDHRQIEVAERTAAPVGDTRAVSEPRRRRRARLVAERSA
jgi:hypothetical protein